MLVFLRPFFSENTYLLMGFWYVPIVLSFSLFYLAFSSRPIFAHSSFNPPILAFLAALLLSISFAVSRQWSLFELYWFLPNIAIFYVVSKIGREQRQQLIYTMIAAASIISIYAIYQHLFGYPDILRYLVQTKPDRYVQEFIARRRVIATFISPNLLAGYQIIILFLGIGVLIDNRKNKKRLFCSGAILLMLTALLLTKSLGAIFVFVVSLCLFFFLLLRHLQFDLHYKRVIFQSGVIIAVVTTLALIIFVSSSLIFSNHLPGEPLNLRDYHNSLVQRLFYWQASSNIIKDYSLTGVGWGNFGLVYKYYKSRQAKISNFAHNCLLQITAETGILGLFGFFWIVLVFLREGLNGLNRADNHQYGLSTGLFCAGCAFLLHNLISLTFYFGQVAFHWWIILALLQKSDAE